jgi:hypothetical protein
MRLQDWIMAGLVLGSIVACAGREPAGSAQQAIDDGAGATPADGGCGEPDGATPPPASGTCFGTCATPAGPIKVFTSVADVEALTGTWALCSGEIKSPAAVTGIRLDVQRHFATFLVSGGSHGMLSSGNSKAYERQLAVVDATATSGPGERAYKLAILDADNEKWTSYVARYSECPRRLELEDEVSGRKAAYVAQATPAAPFCILDGTWESLGTVDPPASMKFTGSRFSGGPLGAELPAEATFSGTYALASDYVLTVFDATGMECGDSGKYKVVFDETCSQVTMQTVLDNCNGSRRYLHERGRLVRH